MSLTADLDHNLKLEYDLGFSTSNQTQKAHKNTV